MNVKVAQLDTEFSIFIRLKYADFTGYVQCYTCPARKHYKEMQCGHFRGRANQMTRFDENNCRPQCADCNCNRNGMQDVFEEELRDEIGDEAVDEIIENSKGIADHSDYWYTQKISYYRAKNRDFAIM